MGLIHKLSCSSITHTLNWEGASLSSVGPISKNTGIGLRERATGCDSQLAYLEGSSNLRRVTFQESEVLASSVVNSMTQAFGKLLDLWNEIGISRELQLERMQTAKAHIEALLNEMIEEECNWKEKIENDIEVQKTQLNAIRYELKLDPYQVDDGLSIIQLEKEFRLALENALKEKQERLKKLKQLQQDDQTLCTELCATPYYIPTGSVPSCFELEELKEHVQQLLKIKEERLEEFLKLRREIKRYNKEIGHIPDGTLEKDILSDEEECICLTKKNIEDLQLLVHQLQAKQDFLIASKEDLVKEVQRLWDQLQWPGEKQEQLTKMTSKCSITEAVKMWEEELFNLEELKKASLKEITLKVRQELENYWKKCFYADEQRSTFQAFYNDNFSEVLLNQHDEELLKMKDVYEKSKHIYDSVHKWEAIWNQFIELEKKSTDPSRLLNRGGNLLKDERERSKIQKQLLKLGEELTKSIANWEKENDSCFLINSQRFLDSMAHQLEHHKVKKDQPKFSLRMNESATPKRAVKRPAAVNTPTPSKMRKVASNLTVLKATSCINIGANVAVAGKQSVQTKKELSVQSSNSRILSSTFKENLNE
ncbi:protein regulator of cytokinesis 1-like isoform X2 [Rhineura floridana]|uniref:protein regulator of cytokinesis 1-like isoform X2 n=1 Tax=Rhineura floridana TaxID=261503 RepID=UPI002AC859EE|nr:protein regulator of cytokinesis 1-like isoform X2 [Rhineura floridana]